MITVDWSVGAGTINYITARNRVSEAGAVVASFIDFLHENNYLRFEDLNIIGHSLGWVLIQKRKRSLKNQIFYSGQVVGLAGKSVTRGRIQVILSLDPAGKKFETKWISSFLRNFHVTGPLFSLNNPDGRVADTDGVYVEVIHTNGGTLGFREPLGQADFFPNFGRSQPVILLTKLRNCIIHYSWFRVVELTYLVNALMKESTIFTLNRFAQFSPVTNVHPSKKLTTTVAQELEKPLVWEVQQAASAPEETTLWQPTMLNRSHKVDQRHKLLSR